MDAGEMVIPLPKAFARWREDDEDAGAWGRPDCDVYTADQLRAYGAACAAERDAVWRDAVMFELDSNGQAQSIVEAAAAAIRASAMPAPAPGAETGTARTTPPAAPPT